MRKKILAFVFAGALLVGAALPGTVRADRPAVPGDGPHMCDHEEATSPADDHATANAADDSALDC